ncbi:MAG: type II/IV secretion system protein, partial [Chloroflexi bacterium]
MRIDGTRNGKSPRSLRDASGGMGECYARLDLWRSRAPLIKFPSRPNKPGVIPLAGQAAPPAVAEAEKPDADEQKGGAAHAEQATSADLRAVVQRDIKDAMAPIAPPAPPATNGNGNAATTPVAAPPQAAERSAQVPQLLTSRPAMPAAPASGTPTVEYEANDAINLAGRRLGELLVGWKVTNDDTIRKALKKQRKDRRPIGALLVDLVTGAVGWQMGLTPVELDKIEADWRAVHTIDGGFAREKNVVPYRIDDEGVLRVATLNPRDYDLGQELLDKTGLSVRMELADYIDIQRALDRYYSVFDKVGVHAERAILDARVVTAPVTELATLSADAPVVQIVNLILAQGLRDRVSDIHIEPQFDRLRVRFRVDGALRDVASLPTSLGGPVASRLKIMADMDIVDRHRAQDGQTTMELDGRTVDIRIATMETVWGEKVVLRLLDRSRSLLPLGQLGLRAEEHHRMQRLIGSPYGLFIVAGPTGAGKTTTLYAALNELDRQRRNITTIEDPVEYQFDNINQIQINKLAGMTFANGLRAILRQDPDVILVGEIRDAETAQIAIQSALTGHLVLASLHAADSVGALHRFLDMGVESYLVASAVIGVVAQRLMRMNCPECSRPVEVKAEESEFYRTVRGTDPERMQTAGNGCRRCSDTGFYERRGVFECMPVD